MVNSDGKLWSKFLCFVIPVSGKRHGADNKYCRFCGDHPTCFVIGHNSEYLKGFPQTHVISQNSTLAKHVKACYPIHATLLIGTQLCIDKAVSCDVNGLRTVGHKIIDHLRSSYPRYRHGGFTADKLMQNIASGPLLRRFEICLPQRFFTPFSTLSRNKLGSPAQQ